jgi:hypothetical protein
MSEINLTLTHPFLYRGVSASRTALHLGLSGAEDIQYALMKIWPKSF